MKWHTETWAIKKLKIWAINPRSISDKEYKELKSSVKKLGNWDSLVINTDGTVIAGNQRLKIHKENGDKEVEVRVPERKLSEEEIKEIGLKSNRHSGDWDTDLLSSEFEDMIESLGLSDLLVAGDDDFYTAKIESPVYEPKGKKPELHELYDMEKYIVIMENIDKSKLPEDIKEFLKLGATRFIKFNFSNIAEYFAHSDKSVKDYFVEQALVIVDYEKAIELGFVRFIEEMTDSEGGDNEE